MGTSKLCKVDGCDKPVDSGKGYTRSVCGAHRLRKRRTGEYGGPIKAVPPVGSSTWEVVEFNGWTVTESGCWEYNGPRFAKGYGQVKVNGSPKLLHRISYEHFNGPIPDGLVVRHTCDNPPCMNPTHLIIGTQYDNIQDRNERGRTYRRGKTKSSR